MKRERLNKKNKILCLWLLSKHEICKLIEENCFVCWQFKKKWKTTCHFWLANVKDVILTFQFISTARHLDIGIRSVNSNVTSSNFCESEDWNIGWKKNKKLYSQLLIPPPPKKINAKFIEKWYKPNQMSKHWI